MAVAALGLMSRQVALAWHAVMLHPRCRLFVLLAIAGMDKSVFSAAIHTKLLALTNKDSNIIMVSLMTHVVSPPHDSCSHAGYIMY